MHNLKLNWNVPFKEIPQSLGRGDDFFIEGVALNSITTSNNHKFLAEELKKSAKTLTNVPLLVDHSNMVKDIKGTVIRSSFDDIEENIKFKAKIMDKEIKEMVKDRRINSVSVGAIVEEIEEEDGVLTPRGIIFKELSLVAIPADQGATFGIALKEMWESDEKEKEEKDPVDELELENSIQVKGGLNMETEQITKELDTLSKKVDEFGEIPEQLKAQGKLISDLINAVSVREADADEKKEEDKEKEKEKEKEEEKSKEKEKVEDEKEKEVTEEKLYRNYNYKNLKIVQENGSLGGGAFTYTW